MSESTRIVAYTWQRRSATERFEEWLANLGSYWW
jgi:hypothetical protein